MCPGTDLNRYDRCGSQDFKSCVSTNSTTRAGSQNQKQRKLPTVCCFQKKSSAWEEIFRAEDRARTGYPDLGKVVLYQMSYFRRLLFRRTGCKNKSLPFCNKKNLDKLFVLRNKFAARLHHHFMLRDALFKTFCVQGVAGTKRKRHQTSQG